MVDYKQQLLTLSLIRRMPELQGDVMPGLHPEPRFIPWFSSGRLNHCARTGFALPQGALMAAIKTKAPESRCCSEVHGEVKGNLNWLKRLGVGG